MNADVFNFLRFCIGFVVAAGLTASILALAYRGGVTPKLLFGGAVILPLILGGDMLGLLGFLSTEKMTLMLKVWLVLHIAITIGMVIHWGVFYAPQYYQHLANGQYYLTAAGRPVSKYFYFGWGVVSVLFMSVLVSILAVVVL